MIYIPANGVCLYPVNNFILCSRFNVIADNYLNFLFITCSNPPPPPPPRKKYQQTNKHPPPPTHDCLDVI